MDLLSVQNLDAFYGKKQVLSAIDLELGEREICALIGPNGAGKSTVLRTIFGLVRSRRGVIRLGAHDISHNKPAGNVALGMAYVPQGARVFRDLTVDENITMAGYTLPSRAVLAERRGAVLGSFPRLRERLRQKAAGLSGGERQMLAFAMATMVRPRLLLIDEPSIGLAPVLVRQIFDSIVAIRDQLGTSVLIVEQQAQQVLRIADVVSVIRAGVLIGHGKADNFRDPEALRRVYLRETEVSTI